jgi:hypothetical protein
MCCKSALLPEMATQVHVLAFDTVLAGVPLVQDAHTVGSEIQTSTLSMKKALPKSSYRKPFDGNGDGLRAWHSQDNILAIQTLEQVMTGRWQIAACLTAVANGVRL